MGTPQIAQIENSTLSPAFGDLLSPGASAPAKITVRSAISNLRARSIGGRALVIGSVAPGTGHVKATVQVFARRRGSKGAFKQVATSRLSTNDGNFAVAVSLAPNRWQIKVKFQDPKQVVSTTSGTVTVTVGATPAFSVGVRSLKVSRRGALKITGGVKPGVSGGRMELLALNTTPGKAARFGVVRQGHGERWQGHPSLQPPPRQRLRVAARVHPEGAGAQRLRVADDQRKVGPLMRRGDRRPSACRRPGIIPGRRFALALAAALVAVGYTAEAAAADPTVVSATIYQGSAGGIATPSVTLSTLQNGCPAYAGPGTSPMYLYPSGQPYEPASGSSWALETVLTCGLQVPLANVTGVQVDNPSSGFEIPLTSAQLNDPSQFHDPAAPNALPVISNDGGQDQNTYVRPWLGPGDANGSDRVVQSGNPINLIVYENGAPLQVTASSSIATHTVTTMNVHFSASVQGPDGTAIPDSQLTWSWNFGDSATSTDPAPDHSYPLGTYFVTVQVTDAGAGLGGTKTITVSAPSAPGPGTTARHGSGKNRKGKSSTGATNSNGNRAGGPVKKQKTKKSRTPGQSRHSAGNTTGTSGSAANTTATSTTPATPHPPRRHAGTADAAACRVATATGAGAPRPRPGPAVDRRVVRTGSHARLVAGLLISDVTPLPPGSSPLVHTVAAPSATAPAVRRAVAGSSTLAPIGAGLAIVLLLGLGAGRELRWHQRWRVILDRASIPAMSTHDIDEAIFHVASALQVPVLILALLALALVIFELGSFGVELRGRRRRRFATLSLGAEQARLALLAEIEPAPPRRPRGSPAAPRWRPRWPSSSSTPGPTAVSTRSTRRWPTSTSMLNAASGAPGCWSRRPGAGTDGDA